MAKLFAGMLVCTVAVLIAAGSLQAADGEKKGPKKEGERPSAEKIFQKLDADSDGKLTAKELAASPRLKGDEAKAAEAIKKMDTDESGDVCVKEFGEAMKKRAEGAKKGEKKGEGKERAKKGEKKPAEG